MLDGATYELILNAVIALLFGIAFAIVGLSYPGQRHVGWFVAVYLLGMLTPLSELGVRFSDDKGFFVATSYLALLMSTVVTPLGLAALAERPLPRRLAGAIFAGGIATRVAIWDGPRDNLGYEFAYQAPFAAAALLAMIIAIGVWRRRANILWLVLAIVMGCTAAYFLVKPLLANAFGSGATAAAYTASRYALFSQATGGVLIVGAGLTMLLIVVNAAFAKKIQESETDALTGLLNRRGIERHAERLIAQARRHAEPLALVLFDIDHFKHVNDSFGHAAGDDVLRAVADLLRTAAPSDAAAARLGGEEFVLILDRTTQAGAWHAAQAVRVAVRGLGSHLPPITISGGLAELLPGDTLYSWLERADRSVYAAKTAGRDQICPQIFAAPGQAPQIKLVASA